MDISGINSPCGTPLSSHGQNYTFLNLLLVVGCVVERGGVCMFRRGADELRGVLLDGLLHRGQRIL